MAVTIDEFQVVSEPAPAPAPAATGGADRTDETALTVEELETLLALQMERLARVWAH